MENTCWICGIRPADSAEHKFKASDLKRMMGDGDELIHFDADGNQTSIRGQNGIKRDRFGKVKYEKSICRKCNNTVTQPHDDAYDSFVEHLVDVHDSLPRIKFINLRKIYGRDWREQSRNLARYFAKHFGCRLMRDAGFVPPSLPKFINGATDLNDVRMNLVVRRDRMDIPADCGSFMDPFQGRLSGTTGELTDAFGAYYSGSVGVRFAWQNPPHFDPKHTQFFNYARPAVNSFSGLEAVNRGFPD